MDSNIYNKEKEEAIQAGQMALQSLYEAHDELKGARNWGIVDILGGGFITTLIKRSKMDKCRQLIERARFYLSRFETELRDIHIELEMDDFSAFFDYYDNVFADMYVQQQINNAGQQIEYAIAQVEDVLNRLCQ